MATRRNASYDRRSGRYIGPLTESQAKKVSAKRKKRTGEDVPYRSNPVKKGIWIPAARVRVIRLNGRDVIQIRRKVKRTAKRRKR